MATGITVFDVGPDNRVYSRTRLKSQEQWSVPFDLGGYAVGRPAACTLDNSNGFLFIRDADGAVWTKFGKGDTWSPDHYGWTALGGKTLMNPVCTTDKAGDVFVFVTGTDNKLYVNVFKDGKGLKWTGWIILGGDLSSSPAVVSTGPNQIEVVATFNDGSVWGKSFDGNKWAPGQTDWISLGGKTLHRPGVASWAPGHLDLFAVGTDDALYSKVREGGKWWPGTTEWNRIDQT